VNHVILIRWYKLTAAWLTQSQSRIEN